jgi:hypothetical protein
MYPAGTSFMVISVALARWLEQGGSILASYPYWYMGTTPFRYLTGPVVPLLLWLGRQIVPLFSLFDWMFIWVGLHYLLGGVGVWLLTRELIKSRKNNQPGFSLPVLATGFYLFTPIMAYFFPFSDGIGLMSRSWLSWSAFFCTRFLTDTKKKDAFWLFLTILLAILTDTTIITPMILVLSMVLVVVSGWDKAEVRVRQLAIIFLAALGVATYWYTPSYWLVILQAPSFAGKPLYQVVGNMLKLLPSMVAIVAAFLSVRILSQKNKLLSLGIYWVVVFGLLTLLRFLSDPDFWQDWTAYMVELQIGMSFLLAEWMSKKDKYTKGVVILTGLILFSFIFTTRVVKPIQRYPETILAYRLGSQLKELVQPGKRVFLSGSSVFWLNTWYDLPQIRGGNDRVSADRNWREIAWELREGDSPEKAYEAMVMGEIHCLVVHQNGSSEFYRDYKYPTKFSQIKGLEVQFDQSGDLIYCLDGEQ